MAKLKAARDRKKASTGKCGGRKTYAEARGSGSGERNVWPADEPTEDIRRACGTRPYDGHRQALSGKRRPSDGRVRLYSAATAVTKMISERTKAALAAAKRRGVKLGGDRGVRLTAEARRAGNAANAAIAAARASDLSGTVKELQAGGCESLRALAEGLDARGIPAARGGKWSAVQVSRLLARINPNPFEPSPAGG